MKRSTASSVGILMAVGVWLMAGCARPPLISVPEPAPEREWMHQESGAHHADGGGVFYGIGRAAGLRNATLLRATADNQARSEMAGVLQAYVTALAREAGFDSRQESDLQGLNGLTRSALQHARIVDHWFDPPQGELSSLCRLELAAFKAVLQADPQLDTPLKNAMLDRAEQVHTRLARRPRQ
jgi:hypothetical protein